MISIKEIAKICGVSTATVSRIINNKADDISNETKEKVLKVVKQYNYTPYGVQRFNNNSKTFTIGFLIKKLQNTNLIINGLMSVLNKEGYSLMLFDSEDSLEKEKANLNKISSKNLDGLIWEPVCEESLDNADTVKLSCQQIVYLNSPVPAQNSFSIDFEKIGYYAAVTLIEKGHTSIGCLGKKTSARSAAVIRGFKRALFDNSILFNQNMVLDIDDFKAENIKNHHLSSLIVSHFAITEKMITQFSTMAIDIPKELSLISLRDDVRQSIDLSRISTVRIPNFEFGEFIGHMMVGNIEGKETNKAFGFEPELESYVSVDLPLDKRMPKVTVVGSINVDNIIYLDEFPTPGRNRIASECSFLPGGKGLNQSMAIASLGKEVTLIGKIGKDIESNYICNALGKASISTDSLVSSPDSRTGKAFITVNKRGESIVTVAKGANTQFTTLELKTKNRYFENTGICLLQTEIPIEVVREAAKTAKGNGAITILKPATIDSMEDKDYCNIDIIIPNRNEALQISGKDTVEKAAEYFLSKGPLIVIITLDKDGCLLKTSERTAYFPAPKVDVIDATGGSDAFISAFACEYLDNRDVDTAIKAGTIAAGICISQLGASSATITRDTLNKLLEES